MVLASADVDRALRSSCLVGLLRRVHRSAAATTGRDRGHDRPSGTTGRFATLRVFQDRAHPLPQLDRDDPLAVRSFGDDLPAMGDETSIPGTEERTPDR